MAKKNENNSGNTFLVDVELLSLRDLPAVQEEPEEKVEIPKAENIGTSLGDLFKNIQL